jgi:hypothetical protein
VIAHAFGLKDQSLGYVSTPLFVAGVCAPPVSQEGSARLEYFCLFRTVHDPFILPMTQPLNDAASMTTCFGAAGGGLANRL